VKKKPPAQPPIANMINPYTAQDLFDQKANISIGQLLAANSKFTQSVMRSLRKPITRKPNKGKGPATQENNNQEENATA
jgi:hypothetical protein